LVTECTVGFYRARKPQETPLYCLVEVLYDQVKGVWEERYGFWRAFVDDVAGQCQRLRPNRSYPRQSFRPDPKWRPSKEKKRQNQNLPSNLPA